jgi:hypothetical protein
MSGEFKPGGNTARVVLSFQEDAIGIRLATLWDNMIWGSDPSAHGQVPWGKPGPIDPPSLLPKAGPQLSLGKH